MSAIWIDARVIEFITNVTAAMGLAASTPTWKRRPITSGST